MDFNEPDQKSIELLSITSHQLKTPLLGIKKSLALILGEEFGASVKIKGVLNEVLDESNRLGRLLNVFLEVSRIDSGNFSINQKQADLMALIEEAAQELRHEAEYKNLEFIFRRPTLAVPVFRLDAVKIKEVVLHLLDNAIKYTQKGKIEIYLSNIGQAVQVKIKDSGRGLAKTESRSIFNKFARGEGISVLNPNGNGLGLFIAKKIIEAHGGKIWAESVGRGMGSAFIFTLPMV